MMNNNHDGSADAINKYKDCTSHANSTTFKMKVIFLIIICLPLYLAERNSFVYYSDSLCSSTSIWISETSFDYDYLFTGNANTLNVTDPAPFSPYCDPLSITVDCQYDDNGGVTAATFALDFSCSGTTWRGATTSAGSGCQRIAIQNQTDNTLYDHSVLINCYSNTAGKFQSGTYIVTSTNGTSIDGDPTECATPSKFVISIGNSLTTSSITTFYVGKDYGLGLEDLFSIDPNTIELPFSGQRFQISDDGTTIYWSNVINYSPFYCSAIAVGSGSSLVGGIWSLSSILLITVMLIITV